MRKSIALLLGLSLATLTAASRRREIQALHRRMPQVPLFRKLCPMLPRPRRKHLRPPPAIPPQSSAMCWMALWIFPPTRQAAA